MCDAGASAIGAGTSELQVDISPRGHLRGVGFHGTRPCIDNLRLRDIDQHWLDIPRLCIVSKGVKEKLINRMAGRFAKLGDAAISRKPGRIANERSEAPVIGVLILNGCGSKHDAGPDSADDSRELDRVDRFDLQMRITIQFDKLDRRAKDRRGGMGFLQSLIRRSVRARFTLGADDEMNRTTRIRLARDHTAAAELDIIRMRAKYQDRRQIMLGIRCRLHRFARSDRG